MEVYNILQAMDGTTFHTAFTESVSLRQLGVWKYAPGVIGYASDGNVRGVEVQEAEDYVANLSSQSTGYKVTCKVYTSGDSQPVMFVTPSSYQRDGDLEVEKISKESKERINMKFKIQTSDGWLSGSSGSYTYNATYDNASEYTTSNGLYTLEKLSVARTYKVWETAILTSGYDITKQPGYDSTKNAVNLTGNTGITLSPGEKVSKEYSNISLPGDLVVNKKDKDTGEPLRIGFKVKTLVKDDNNTTNKEYWLKLNSDGTYSYRETESNATIFYTDGGSKTLSNLAVSVKYKIYEVKTADDDSYDISQQGTKSPANAPNLTGDTWITITEDSTTHTWIKRVSYDNVTSHGKLIVKKIDKYVKEYETGEKRNLKIGFKVQTEVNGNKYWLEEDNNVYNYKGTTGKMFYTDEETGIKEIPNLTINSHLGIKYRIWEFETPGENYKLEDQPGYDNEMKAVPLGDWITLDKEKPVSVTYENYSRFAIEGYVWVDKAGKGLTTNSLYKNDEFDKYDVRLPEVKVYLKLKGNNNTVLTTTTDENGNYSFNKDFKTKLLYGEMDNYYIEFDYSEMTIDARSGKEYIPVAYNSKELKNVVTNGSRAMMQDVAEYDENLTGKATTYTGTNAGELKIFGLRALAENNNNPADQRLFDTNTGVLKYMNLGIKPIYEPIYNIAEDIKYVKIVLNNHQYVYEYGKSGLEGLAAPEVAFQKPIIGTYDRYVYPSAIYDLIDNNNTEGQLRVYVVYEILIKNTTDHVEKELYEEQKLHITKLTNTFDTNKYEFPAADDKFKNASVSGTNQNFIDFENKIKGNFDNWSLSGNTATYDLNKDKIILGRGEGTVKYIQYKVKDQEIINILNHQEEGVEEKVRADTLGYHEYTRDDYSWVNTSNLPRNQTHFTTVKPETAEASSIKFKLGKERVVTGTVFEDTVDMTGRQEGEVIGNGLYDTDKEKPVSGVLVEIINGNKDFDSSEATIAKTYIGSNDKKTYSIEPAIKVTGSNGKFSIEGIMPGDYYIRLTYGNGTRKIVKVDGTTEEIGFNSKIAGKEATVDEYKSTIVTNNAARNALGYAKNEYGKEWYKYVGTDLASVAIDSLTMREKHNTVEKQSNIPAGTALLDITIENTKTNYTTAEEALNKETFPGFSFGIIVQPKQRLSITKKIVNVKLTNTPNILFNGNPENSDIPGVTDLDGKNDDGGSTYTRMEIEKENIYGSELALKYFIEVKNISNINYYETNEQYEGWYYKFGKWNNDYSKQIKISVDDVVDCYDPVLQDITKATDLGEKEVTAIKVEDADDYQKRSIDKQAEHTQKTYTEVFSIKGWGILDLYATTNTKLEFRKILSTQNDDLDYTNGSGVAKAKNTIDPTYKGNKTAEKTLSFAKPVELPEPAYARAVISAPTGSNENFNTKMIVISTITALSIVAVGIVVIMLKKRKSKIDFLK